MRVLLLGPSVRRIRMREDVKKADGEMREGGAVEGCFGNCPEKMEVDLDYVDQWGCIPASWAAP